MTRVLKIYKSFFSPFLRVIFGSTFGGCRFYPSCSDYTHDAFEEYGLLRGSWLALSRVLRCNPFSKGGLDLVFVQEDKRSKECRRRSAQPQKWRVSRSLIG